MRTQPRARLTACPFVIFNVAVIFQVAAFNTAASAHDFRIDSMVFAAGNSNAICRNRTFFVGPTTYDEMLADATENRQPGGGTNGSPITIIDAESQRVTRIDLVQQRKVEIGFEQIANFVFMVNDSAQRAASVAKFAAQPKFDVRVEEDRIQLLGTTLTYRARTVPAPSPAHAAQFRTFADWSARINTLRPGLPPQARLRLNQELFSHSRLPEQIEREIQLPEKSTALVTSHHEFTWKLSEQDRQRVLELKNLAEQCESVDLATFQNISPR